MTKPYRKVSKVTTKHIVEILVGCKGDFSVAEQQMIKLLGRVGYHKDLRDLRDEIMVVTITELLKEITMQAEREE